jgi:hypothetical protein
MIEIIPTPFLSILIFVLFAWILGLTFFLVKTINHYNSLTKGITKKELKEVLNEVLKNISSNSSEIENLKKLVNDIIKDNLYNIQKVGLTRYNPFAETGGDQSFCLSLLDGNDNGIVISSLHSRDATRIYAKPVKNLKASGYELSEEEKQAIKIAKKIKFKNG